jgi:hypothetical protein
VGKTDDIKSVNNIFGNPISGWTDGLVHETLKKLTFSSECFNLIFKMVI